MEKLDLSKKYNTYYNAKTTPELVTIAPAQYLSLEGKGDPSGEAFARDIQTLYPVAYAIKFMCKAREEDFVVAKLEGLWWFDDEQYSHLSLSEAPTAIPRSEWHYRLLIRLPDFVSEADVQQAIENTVETKENKNAAKVKHYQMDEGKCVQILHKGSFATEPDTLVKLQQFIQAHGFGKNGLHHEIYLSDFRKTPEEKLKTILREPVC